MKLKDLELGIMSYSELRIAPALHSTLDKWLLYAGLAALGSKLESAVQAIAPAAEGAGLIDADGNIDLDWLEKIGLAAFEKQPKVQIWKITFIREDFSDFMRHLRGQNACAASNVNAGLNAGQVGGVK